MDETICGGPNVSLILCCFVVYSTRRLVVCLSMCHFVLVVFSPFSIVITSLGEERANLSAFRGFVRFVLVLVCLFTLPLGVWEGLRFVIVALPGLFSYLFFSIQMQLLTGIMAQYNWNTIKLQNTTTNIWIVVFWSYMYRTTRCNSHRLCFTKQPISGQVTLSWSFQYYLTSLLFENSKFISAMMSSPWLVLFLLVYLIVYLLICY